MGFLVTEAAERPAGRKGECFYCRQPVGSEHGPECVLVTRTVLVRLTVEYPIEVPAHWDAGTVDFHRNEGSWCANNALQELDKLFNDDHGPCMCDVAKVEYLGEVAPARLSEGTD